MIKRTAFCLLLATLVTGCQTNSVRLPWEGPSYSRAVDADPSPLTAQTRAQMDEEFKAEAIEETESIQEQANETGHMDHSGQYAFFDTTPKRDLPKTRQNNPAPTGQAQPADEWPKIESEGNGLTPPPTSNDQYDYLEEYKRTLHGDTASQAQQPAATAPQQDIFTGTGLVPRQKVRVGILLPLSGPQKNLGKGLLNAAQMALFDTAAENFELVPRDTQGTAEGAAVAAQEAIDAGAQLLIGPLFGHSVKAVKPIARHYDINVLAFSTDWSLAGGHTYIMGFLPFVQVQRVAEYASASGYKNIGILAPNSDYGNAVIAAYNSLAYRLGLNTATVARFPLDQSDVSLTIRSFALYDERHTEIEELKVPLTSLAEEFPNDPYIAKKIEQLEQEESLDRLPYDAVLLPVGGEQAISIANLLSYYDLDPDDIKRLGTGLWDDRGLASEAAMEGAWFAAPPPNLRENFVKRYKDMHKETPPRIATLAYDATALAAILAAHGLRHTGNPSYSKRDLTNPNGFAGLDGIFRFRPDGLIERGLAVLEFKDKKMQVIDPAPTSFLQEDIGIQ